MLRPPLTQCRLRSCQAVSDVRRLALPQHRGAASQVTETDPNIWPSTGVDFVGFAKSARDDVLDSLQKREGGSLAWVERLHEISNRAVDLWPTEAPHWRVALPIIVPPTTPSFQGQSSELSAALSLDGSEAGGLDPLARASCLRAICAATGRHTLRRATPLLNALVDGGGVKGDTGGGLALQLPLGELLPCVRALASCEALAASQGPLGQFLKHASSRLLLSLNLRLDGLLEVKAALEHFNQDTAEVGAAIRAKLSAWADAANTGTGLAEADVAATVASVQQLGESHLLKEPLLRQALLPDSLEAAVAAKLLPHALPRDGTPSTTYSFVLAMAAGKIALGVRHLSTRDICSALRGVVAMQVSNEDFSLQQGARVLRALWPRVCLSLPYMAPSELSTALRAYWWQLLIFRQELAVDGIARDHPVIDITLDASKSSDKGRQMKDADAMDALKSKLIFPILDRLAEMPLKHTSNCLSVLATPVFPADLLTLADRKRISEAVLAAYPVGEHPPKDPAVGEWWEDFWNAELGRMDTADVLEFCCGLREADPRIHLDVGRDESWWILEAMLQELQERLSDAVKTRGAPVELSHSLLLRMCRCMDLWHGQEVEVILRKLLSSPEALQPLPTPVYAAVLAALGQWNAPKELSLRLAAAFLDAADAGQREVLPVQWADLLCSIKGIDEFASRERVAARAIQRVLPHLDRLEPRVLATVLEALAAQAPASGPSGFSALSQAPSVGSRAVRRALEAGQWDFPSMVGVLRSLGALNWYDDATVGAALKQLTDTPLLEAYAPLLLTLAQTCVQLRVHHAPLLHKIVLWYAWCYGYLRPKPLPSEDLDELIALSDQLRELSFQSLEFLDILAENLKNPKASSRQVLALLSLLARFSHFPSEFKEACSRLVAEPEGDDDLSSLSSADLVNAFNIHLCAVFDGPAALKQWLTEDEAMKRFFQVHTSQKWYQKQDLDRTTFLQSPAYDSLRQAARDEGLDLIPSDPGEVYHVEMVSADARRRLADGWVPGSMPPTALVCVKSREQLRWYMPITVDGMPGAQSAQNRCQRFPFMYRSAVQKVRHLQAMGYRVAVVWMQEWNSLNSDDERRKYLRAAVGGLGQPSTAFSPAISEDGYD